MKDKLNILFAIADDASHMGAYGHKFVHTPHVDQLAKTGVLFNNAFTTNPKCAPSRASILTGMHTWQLKEACTHFCYFPNDFHLYPDLLEEAGYHIGYTGKGWGPGNWERSGLIRNPAGNAYNKMTLTPPEHSLISTIDYVRNFDMFLEAREDGQPFCFWYGCKEPHRKYIEGEGVYHGKKLEDVTVPAYFPDNDKVRSDLCDYAFEIDWFDKQLGGIINKLEEIGEMDNTVIVVTSDNGAPFPRIKGQMYEQDLNLPLIISCPAFKGNRVIDDLVSFIDFAPTFLDIAGLDIPKEMPGKSLLDVLLSERDGFVNPQRNRAYMGRERHDMGRAEDKGYPVRCIRTPDYLYIHNFEPSRYPSGNPETYYTNCANCPTKEEILHLHAKGDNCYYNYTFGLRPQEELYAIKKDPECMENLAQNKDYDVLKKALYLELKEKLIETRDPRILGNGDVFESYAYAKDAKHSWAHHLTGDWVRMGGYVKET
ncbi:sulfatase [Vallitalea pronyensis]|uniref:Sulfatase n=1 Tax=Vallitalea pronyensis TaxID=1348613 RepID=A0A8J8MPY6_9FIRM|nr:sulfatase [Vallitalea pronyensis]QUI25248.1 sulfatase [Vallitalea pronyensis]